MYARDKLLLQRWKTGRDAQAFSELVARYADMVFAVGKRALGDEEAAKDLAQDVFLKLARQTPDLETSLSAWFHRVTINAAIDAMKKDSARRAREERYMKGRQEATHPEWNDIRQLLDEAIEELPEKYRRPLVAHYFEQRTHKNIAHEHEVTRHAVTYCVRQGLNMLSASQLFVRDDIFEPAVHPEN